MRKKIERLIKRNLFRHDYINRIVSFFARNNKIESFNIDHISSLASSINSAQYACNHMQSAKRLTHDDLISYCVELSSGNGLFLEFGVFSGRSINYIASQVSETVYGFDSFQGLPETWRPGFAKGTFAQESLPKVAENVELIVGWFDETLSPFLETRAGTVSFLHVDCDLYSSTKTIFSLLKPRFVAGTIILFDEYFNYPGWEQHEFKAWKEFIQETGIEYEYIGLNPEHQQVAVRLTSVPGYAVKT